MKQVVIYTDGACSGNPGPGGWGALVICGTNQKEFSGSEEYTTNNRMELTAAIKALELLQEPCAVNLYTDSQYVKNGITQWINGWLKNDWKNSENKPVKNQELWQRLLQLSQKHKVCWNWVEGHMGNEFNERVDKLAKKQCNRKSIYSDFR
ncbi:MAG: ribonuclease HI [Holosporaceae bacterium]|jgi:ribonuclease HI|nr:ribonuclease HI [Holosporaceae bacterium]